MNLTKETTENIPIRKRKTLEFKREGEFFHLRLSNFKLDAKDREAELLQTVEITLTMDEVAKLASYITSENFDKNLPF